MSSIEQARNNLIINGYVHPNTPSSNKSIYKTFNNESKENAYITTKTKHPYAKFTYENSYINKSQGCPDCGEDALYECECKFKDKQCSKGHIWYINTKGHIEKGDPHD